MLGEKAIETLGMGLDELQKIADRRLNNPAQLVDLTAKIRACSKKLDEVNNNITAKMKTHLLESSRTLLEGDYFIAEGKTITKSKLDTDKVKQFLGKRLPQFQVESEEFRLTFKAKAG